jgi:2-succinyl-6-hydroxy-2,4-cyclohexadiene-1-carboxylate synthase
VVTNPNSAQLALSVARSGDSTNPPLLLLHGFMGNSEDWQGVITKLSQDFYCISLNLPGHRLSSYSPSSFGELVPDGKCSIFQIAQEILTILPAEPINIIGYSLGGRIALYLALHYPDRCQKVVLESTSWGLPTESERQARRKTDTAIARKLRCLDLDWLAFINNWYSQAIFAGMTDHPNFPALYQRRVQQDPQTLANSLVSAGLGTQPYFKDLLISNQIPLLLLVGEWDKKFVGIAQEMNIACSQAKLLIVSHCSHNVHFQQSDRWLQAVQEFLA